MFESTSTPPTSKPQKEKSLSENDIEQISSLLQNASLVEDDANEEPSQSAQDLPAQIKERIIYPIKVHLTMSPETARLLPLALR